ncbi:MAG: GNAT family N-acetyltransferase [Anaerolineae bacterium]|nr:GNAT family N-acetyltransferase [Anaerolineae bacterium]
MNQQITTPHGVIDIRPAQETDYQTYRELRLEALRNHPEAFGADYAANAEQPMTFWTERLRSLGSNNMIYFAVHNEALVGMGGIYRGNSQKTQHSATIVSVYVQPEWRGLKIAEGLVFRCIEWGRTQRAAIVKLTVSATNTTAIRVYSRCGFAVYGIEPQTICLDGIMYDGLLMSRHIV